MCACSIDAAFIVSTIKTAWPGCPGSSSSRPFLADSCPTGRGFANGPGSTVPRPVRRGSVSSRVLHGSRVARGLLPRAERSNEHQLNRPTRETRRSAELDGLHRDEGGGRGHHEDSREGAGAAPHPRELHQSGHGGDRGRARRGLHGHGRPGRAADAPGPHRAARGRGADRGLPGLAGFRVDHGRGRARRGGLMLC